MKLGGNEAGKLRYYEGKRRKVKRQRRKEKGER
jgi:hypothetical protein